MAETKSDGDKKCGICNTKTSKYCCPRCGVLYCSLDCYKSETHGECSEEFYRECVNEELASYQTDDESRRKMLDILKRMRNQDLENSEGFESLLDGAENVEDGEDVDSDDELGVDLHERVKDLNLDDADALWNALTEDERNEFEALLNQGDVGSIMPQWEPWWTFHRPQELVQDMDKKNDKETEALKKCPTLKNVPKLDSLTTVQPSPAIKFNITNILASYVFVARYFNGDLEPVETVAYLYNICSNLDANANFDSLQSGLEAVVQKCLQSELIQTDELSLEVMKHDTLLILQGPSDKNKLHYCKAALSHLHSLLCDAKSSTKCYKEEVRTRSEFSKKFPEQKKDYLPKLDLSKIKKCIKKIEYYLSYIENYGMNFE